MNAWPAFVLLRQLPVHPIVLSSLSGGPSIARVSVGEMCLVSSMVMLVPWTCRVSNGAMNIVMTVVGQCGL